MRSVRLKNALLTILLTALGLFSAFPADGQVYNCLPSCSAVDGRFLAIANGAGLVTLSDTTMDLEISVPAGTTNFTVGVFDGDARGLDLFGVSHWDTSLLGNFTYTLYADPNRDHAAATVVPLSGQPTVLSTAMPDNDWIDFTVTTDASAKAPSGNYFYLLRIQLAAPAVTLNAFKVRTGGALVGGSSLFPTPKPFSYIAALTGNSVTGVGDYKIIYPGFPAITPTTYDGFFSFFFDEAVSQHDVAVWDGDLDHGKFDNTDKDTDDPDTPNAPFKPSWATLDTLFEGVAVGLPVTTTGNPPDDRNPAGSGIYLLKPPSVRYDLIFPNSQTFANNNPSGNQEWEQFKISTDPLDPSVMDYHTSVVPPGTYEVRIQGVDMQNLNALLMPGRVLCVSEAGVPCAPLRPFLVGDTVFSDANGNGVQDPGEPGIPNVVLELSDTNGFPLGTAITDADGHYKFEVEALTYTVTVAGENFAGEGALAGCDLTTPDSITETVVNDNVLTFDFGCRGAGSIGDRVWNDRNGNGVQDPDEPGINDLLVRLLDSDGNEVDAQTTSGDGNYLFEGKEAGNYTVVIDTGFMPGGLIPTYDLDGVSSPHTASFTFFGGTKDDVDFGYQPDGSIGDRVWNDANGNGAQDPGETGIVGVPVRLRDANNLVVATATTGADGIYTFDHVIEGSYTVEIDTTAPALAGLVPTYDFDGIVTTPNQAFVQLAGGTHRTEIDFGYASPATASLGDRVWNDRNGDGVQNGGEPGLNGVTVELLDAGNNVVATTTTSGDGNYTFSNLYPGTYTVRVVAASLPAGMAPTFDADGVGTPNVTAVTLTTGQTRTDIDFGYRGTASVGDRVWTDADGDGIQDGGETGINGVTVELLDAGSNVVASTTTSGDGNYTFSFLNAGNYSVRVVAASLPAGVAPTYDLDGVGTPNIASFTLTGGQARTDVDFGYRGTGSVGDRLWLDTNGNGIQDPGETGINGSTVQLFSGATLIATTTSAGDGNYTFNNLSPGNYTVKIVPSTLPAGVTPTYDLDGIATANEATFTLAAGASRTDVDFGYRGTASVGDRVWVDTNANGVQDPGETGINGVTLELLSGTTVVASTTTAGDGGYTFSNLIGGTYSVRVVASTLPAGTAPTYDLDGIATPNIAAFTLNAGANRTDVDFGYRYTASVGDRLWIDTNGNGVQEAGETGINGATVQLLDGANVVIGTTTTAGDGNYTFSNLIGGTYSVRVVAATLPAGVAPTYDLDGTGTPNIATFTLAAGASRTDVDFGYRSTGSVGDRLWLDTNGNGVQDSGETGINGATVELLSGTTVVATATTAGDGNYTFNNLSSGTYSVRVVASSLPAGVAPTFDLDGIGTPNIATFTLAAGANRTDVDFGYRYTGSVGDRVWNDADGDGVQDADETGINGLTVQLLSGTTVTATTTTAGDGNYTFSNLAPGTYTVKVVPPAGFAPTFDLDGIGTANQATFTLAAGASRTDVDFGYRGTASVGDRVWNDADGDGVQDAGETGLNGVTVQLLSGTTVIATTTTAGDGNYTFSNLSPGTYTVKVVPPAGVAPTFDLDGIATANQATFTLNAGAAKTDVDFGYRGTASVGDRVWNDANGNGVQDSGETGLNGVTVELLSGTTVIATTTTAGNGNYTFSNLTAGTYSVRVVSGTVPAGHGPTFDLDGTGTPNIATFTLTAGQARTDVDFGYRGTLSVGDRVWNDANGNGVQEATETGLNGVSVQLLDSGNNVIATATTAGNGNYSFTNLPAGTYTVRVVSGTLPAGYTQTFDLDGTGTAHQATFSLTASRTDVDFGYRAPVCTAGYFKDTFTTNSFSNNEGTLSWSGSWIENDTAGAGVSAGNVTVGTPVAGYMILRDSPDTGTQPSAARQVNLTGFTSATLTVDFHVRGAEAEDAAVIEVSKDGGATYTVLETLTNITGTYISSRTYDISAFIASNTRVRFRITANYGGTDDYFKVDAVRIDAGCAPQTYSIGDRVWKDTDGDGVQDTGEPGISGVTVQLLNSSNTVVATDVTDSDGIYGFANVAAGNYTVKVVSSILPSGYAGTYDLDGLSTAHTASFNLTANRTDVDFGYRPATCTAGYFKDTFTTNSFSNNEGTLSWSGSWIENDTAGAGVSAGNVTVGTPVAGYMILRDSPDTGTQPSAARQVNLSAFSSATLTVDFHIRGVETDDAAVIEISKDGGATYTVLETFTNLSGTYISSRTYDISAYMASNTRVRFRISNNYGGDDDFFKVDTVQISAGCTAQTYAVGDRVWKDTDGDGVQDSGEPGISGVTVQLLNSSSAVIATDVTDSNGIYGFTNIPAGTYTVKVVSSSLPSGYTPTFDLDGTSTPHTVTGPLSADHSDVDFGYRPSTCTAGYFKDTFTTNSFSNNEGTLSWSGAWVESDTAGTGVSSGNVTVGTPVAGYMILRDYPDTGTQPSAARQVSLTGYTSATLTVDFHIRGVQASDAAVIEVSKDGGATYTVLETLTGYTDTYISSRTYNISAYKASNTRIRFRISANYGGADEYFKVDTVRIDASCQ